MLRRNENWFVRLPRYRVDCGRHLREFAVEIGKDFAFETILRLICNVQNRRDVLREVHILKALIFLQHFLSVCGFSLLLAH
jgi:hypothetical protein